MSDLTLRPVMPKQGKSQRGKFTPAQKQYIDRCVEFGCIACWKRTGIAGTPAAWHHEKQRFHGGGMRAPHHHGLALCPKDHDIGPRSVHRNPTAFAEDVGMSEAQLVDFCQNKFGWQERVAA